jgi:hypothetical protein
MQHPGVLSYPNSQRVGVYHIIDQIYIVVAR